MALETGKRLVRGKVFKAFIIQRTLLWLPILVNWRLCIRSVLCSTILLLLLLVGIHKALDVLDGFLLHCILPSFGGLAQTSRWRSWFLPGKATSLSREFQDIAEGKEEIPPHQMLCVTCKILRPIRSKHCIVTNKCVDRFDHFSPIINKPIGRRNYLYFLGFLVSAAYESLSINVLYGAYVVNQNGGQSYWQGLYNNMFLTIVFVLYALHFMFAFRWTLGHIDYIRLGMTGNEALNAYRYSYLSHPEHGTVYNPYEKETFNEAFTDIYNDCNKDVKDLLEDLNKTTKDLKIQSRNGGKNDTCVV